MYDKAGNVALEQAGTEQSEVSHKVIFMKVLIYFTDFTNECVNMKM